MGSVWVREQTEYLPVETGVQRPPFELQRPSHIYLDFTRYDNSDRKLESNVRVAAGMQIGALHYREIRLY